MSEPDPNAHCFVNGFCTNSIDGGFGGTDETCDAHQPKWENGVCVRVENCTDHQCSLNHDDQTSFTADTDSVVPGNCAQAGSITLVCKECKLEKVTPTDTDPTKHNWENGVCLNGCSVECEHETYANGVCAVCEKPHEHADDDWAQVERSYVAATCVKVDTWTEKCAVCGVEKACEGTEVDLVDGHFWNTTTGQCDNTGCEYSCEHNYVDGVCTECTLPCEHKATHDEITKAATCTKEGSANFVCDTCNTVVGEAGISIDRDAHNWIEFSFGAGICQDCGAITTDDPTPDEDEDDAEPALPENPCEEHEWFALSFGGWYCIKCGAIATDLSPLEPEICDHADTYIEVVTPATCRKPGVGNKVCDICEELLEEVEIPVDTENGHDWIELSFGAGICKLCLEMTTDDPTPEVPEDTCEHDWEQVTNSGWVCTKCMKLTTDESVVNPPVEEPEEPKTCPENEHEWFALDFGGWYCFKCGAIATDLSPLEPEICDHADTYIDVIEPATCVEAGVGNKVCDICEELLEENVEIPVDAENGHNYVDGVCEYCSDGKPEEPVEEPCEHNWEQVTNSGWVCTKCSEMTTDDPNAPVEPDEPEYMPGDISMDGIIDGRDELRLMKYLAGFDVEINMEAADLTGDGAVDGRDDLRLLKMLAAQ